MAKIFDIEEAKPHEVAELICVNFHMTSEVDSI